MIIGNMEARVPVRAMAPAEMSGTYSIVLLVTKQTANEEVLENLLPHLDDRSIVCTLQNGIPEESVAALAGRGRTAGGTVNFGATCVEPGVARLTSALEILEEAAFSIGTMDGIETGRLRDVHGLLSKAGACAIVASLMGMRWTKLLINAAMSGMSTALGCLFGDILHDDRALACTAHVADETIKVARAHGIRLVQYEGMDLEVLELAGPEDVPSKRELFRRLQGRHMNLKASMLQDLERGRVCEIDFINGLISSKGRERSIPTPFNDKVVEMVKDEERRGVINGFAALSQFDELLAQADCPT